MLKFPVAIKDISKFEHHNNVSVNVYGVEEKTPISKENKALKFNMTLYVMFKKAIDASVITEPPVCFVTEQMEMYQDTSLLELLDFSKKQLISQIDMYEKNGSG